MINHPYQISIVTDRNLDLDLRQTGSRSIDQPRSDPDSENRRNTSVYNDFNENYTKEEYLSQKAILTSTHENVDPINDKMIKKLTSASEYTYNSAESIAIGDADQNLYPSLPIPQ